MELDNIDWLIVEATQAGLPLTLRPYHQLADQIGIPPEEVMHRLDKMINEKMIRRIGAVPNHYALGYLSNGMSVWNVPDDKIDTYGKKIGAFDFVTHCYHRPRHLPDWPYNLFAMIHGRDRETTENMVQIIADLLGGDNLGHTVLYSTQILKKKGFRMETEAA